MHSFSHLSPAPALGGRPSEIGSEATTLSRLGITQLPTATLRQSGDLHLKFGVVALQGRVLNALCAQGWHASAQGNMLCVAVSSLPKQSVVSPEAVFLPRNEAPRRDAVELAALLSQVLPHGERGSVRALWVPQGQTPASVNLWDVEPLHDWITRQQNSWLLDVMRTHRLQSVFQPIVSCSRPDEIFAYECLLRGRTMGKGRPIAPSRILDAARGSGLLFQVDFAARRTAITGAARHRIHRNGAKIFINFTPMDTESSLQCLRSTLEIVDELKLPRDSIVFEVIESEYIPDAALFGTVLDVYREEGFGVALDDLGAGYASLNLLARLRPNYVKLDMELTRDVHRDNYKALIARKLIETARELDVKVVAEGIECAEESEWLCEHGCDFAQGFYFAAPSSPPPALLIH